MKTQTKRLSTALLLAVLISLLCASAPASASAQEAEKINLVEAMSVTNLDLSPYQGKAIFLNFFTEWCPYCMQEMPDIKKIFETYDQDELQIVLVHVWDREDETHTESVKKTYGLEDMTFFEDTDRSVTQWLGIPGYPTSIFIDKDGYFHSAAPYMMTFEAIGAELDALGVAQADEVAAP